MSPAHSLASPPWWCDLHLPKIFSTICRGGATERPSWRQHQTRSMPPDGSRRQTHAVTPVRHLLGRLATDAAVLPNVPGRAKLGADRRGRLALHRAVVPLLDALLRRVRRQLRALEQELERLLCALAGRDERVLDVDRVEELCAGGAGSALRCFEMRVHGERRTARSSDLETKLGDRRLAVRGERDVGLAAGTGRTCEGQRSGTS